MSTTPDEMAFLQAIADNPADETARLAFADWLQEQGDGPRAEFARLSADFLRCLRELGEKRHALPPEWAEVVDPLFNRVRFMPVTWQHEDGDTVVSAVRVEPGERVVRDQVLVQLDSDHMSSEVTAEESGVVVSVLVAPRDRVLIGQPLLTYLRLPVTLPLPPSAPPAVPLDAFIRGLEQRRHALRDAPVEWITNEILQIQKAAQIVFGWREFSSAAAPVLAARSVVARPADVPQALRMWDALVEVFRELRKRHGQPTGFAEPPAGA